MRADCWEFRSIAIKQSYTCDPAAWFMEMTQLMLLKDILSINISVPTINTHLHVQDTFSGQTLLHCPSCTTNFGTSPLAFLIGTWHTQTYLYHRSPKHNFEFPIRQIHLFFCLAIIPFPILQMWGEKSYTLLKTLVIFSTEKKKPKLLATA